MQPIIAFNVIQKQFSKHESGLIKLEYDINASAGTGGVFVQIHDWPTPVDLAAGLTAPANGAVPIKSWAVPAGATNNYKEFKRGELECANGIFVCVSTTQATLTLGTGSNKFDEVAAELISADVVGTEVNSQAQASQTVWAQAAGATNNHRLVRAVCTNLDAAVRYVQLFTTEGVNLISGTSAPIMAWRLAATGDSGGLDTALLSFGGVGNANLQGIDFALDMGNGTIQHGCTLILSTTKPVYTAPGGSGANFYAEYK